MRAEILHVTNGVIVVGLTLIVLLILLSSLLLSSVDWMSKARSERTGPYKTSSGSQEKASTEQLNKMCFVSKYGQGGY